MCTFPRWVRPDAAPSLALECCLRDNDPTHLLPTWRDHAGSCAFDHHSGGLRELQAVFIGGNHARNRGASARPTLANWVVEQECGRQNPSTGSCALQNPSTRSWHTSKTIPLGLAWFPNARGHVRTGERLQHPTAVAEPPRCARQDSRGGRLYVSVTRDLPVSAAALLRPSTTHPTASG